MILSCNRQHLRCTLIGCDCKILETARLRVNGNWSLRVSKRTRPFGLATQKRFRVLLIGINQNKQSVNESVHVVLSTIMSKHFWRRHTYTYIYIYIGRLYATNHVILSERRNNSSLTHVLLSTLLTTSCLQCSTTQWSMLFCLNYN